MEHHAVKEKKGCFISKLEIIDQKNERPEVECFGEEIEQGVEDAFPPRSLGLVRKRLSFTDQLGKGYHRIILRINNVFQGFPLVFQHH
jgi:hypothetical protein